MKRTLMFAGFGLLFLALSCTELKYYHPLPQQAEEVQKVPHFLDGVFFVSDKAITDKDSLKTLRKNAEEPAYFLSSVFDLPIAKDDAAQYIKLEKTSPGELQMSTFISTPAKALHQYARTIKNDSLDINWDIAGNILICTGKQQQVSNDTVKWVDVNTRKLVELVDGHYFYTDTEDVEVYSFSKKKIFSSREDNEDSDLLVKKHKDLLFFCSKSAQDSLWRINVLQKTKNGFQYFYVSTGEYFKANLERLRQSGKFDEQGERNYIADLSDEAFYKLIAEEGLRENLYFYQIEKNRNLALPIALLAVAVVLMTSLIPRLIKKKS